MQKKGIYGSLLQKSWQNWKPNWWALFVPDLLRVITSVGVMGLLVGFEMVLLVILGYKIVDVQGLVPLMKVPAFVGLVVILLGLDGIIVKVISAYFQAMQVGLFRDAVLGERVHTKKMWKYAREFFWIVVKVDLLMLLVVVGPAGLVGGFALWALQRKMVVIFAVLVGLAILYLVTSGIFFAFALYFVRPLLARKKEMPLTWSLVKESLQFSKDHVGKVLMSFLILVGIRIALAIALMIGVVIVGIPFLIMSAVLPMSVQFPVRLIGFIIQGVVGTYMSVFVYNVCYAKD